MVPRVAVIYRFDIRVVLVNVDLQDYTYEWPLTAALEGETLIYIENKLRHKKQNYLKLYEEREIESTFCVLRKTELLGSYTNI